MKKLIVVTLIVVLLLSGCNYPTPEENSGAKETSIAQTVAADVASPPGDENGAGDEETPSDVEATEPSSGGETPDDPAATETPSETATPESEEVELGEGEQAEFIADVTIPDYSEIETGEEITKTWRIRNTGETTWTTGYIIEFEKGEKLGASTQISMPEEVAPGDMVDISIDFTIPTATGEYSSYWILKNEENQRVADAEDDSFFEIYMVILAVKEEEGASSGGSSSSGSGSIAGGAKVTGASVTADPTTYNGSCPAQISFNYSVTTANAGKVQFNLLFNVVSPSGYSFDPPPQYLVDFSSGYSVYYDYLLFSSDPVTATVRVQAIGENEFLSAPVQFKVNCN